MKTFLKQILSVLLVIVMAIPVLAAKTSTCGNCGETCSYTLEYEEWGDTYHCIRWWCSNCSEDMNMGGNAERHNFYHDYDTDYDVCDECGYEIECECGEAQCDHYDTYTEWDGCDWYEYCSDCDELLDEGTEHGDYEYDDWEYYTSSRHRRYYCCEYCGGDDGYEYDYYDADTEYYKYDSTQHEVVEYCYDCDSDIDSYYEDHSFSYGSWANYSSSQHRRSVSCSDCGYSGTEYADHDLVTSDWKNYSDTQHFRTISCVCGYSLDEYTDHADTDNDGGCDDCTYITSRFSVTVPAFMTIVVSGNGEVYAATNAEIVNNSTAAIAVTDITITTDNGWTLVPYNTDMANEKVDSRQIGFMLNDTDGFDGILSNDGRWTAEKNSYIPLSYDAVVSATSEILTDEQVLTVIFVIGWAA